MRYPSTKQFIIPPLVRQGSIWKRILLFCVLLICSFCIQDTFGQAYNHAEFTKDLTRFPMNGTLYQSTAPSYGGKSTFWSYNPLEPDKRIQLFETQHYVNAMGLNPIDSLLYGVNDDGDIIITGANGVQVRRFVGVVRDLTDQYFIGDVSEDGLLYLYKAQNIYVVNINHKSGNMWSMMDRNGMVDNLNPRFFPINGLSLNIDDWAYNKADSLFYSVMSAGNPTTGNRIVTMTRGGITKRYTDKIKIGTDQNYSMLRETGIYGAVFIDSKQNLWVSSNKSGRFYRINIATNTQTGHSQIGKVTSQNDGAGLASIIVDQGDLPDTYGTSFAGDSMSVHFVDERLLIGTEIDAEDSAFPSVFADGDDNNGKKDEDGIDPIFKQPIVGQVYSMTVKVKNQMGKPAVLAGWIDWNRDGNFTSYTIPDSVKVYSNDISERAQVVVNPGATSVTLTWNVPAGITFLDNYFVRLRLSTDESKVQLPNGVAPDGEIEDHLIGINRDMGDAPDTYKTLLASGGPSHIIKNTFTLSPKILLGSSVVADLDGEPSSNANLAIDDNGITTITKIVPGSDYSITANVVNTTGNQVTVVAWIDWNKNGTFEAREGVVQPSLISGGPVTLTWTGQEVAYTKLDELYTFLRIRVTSDPITTNDVGGEFSNGEVEDYQIPIEYKDYGDAPDTYKTFTASGGPSHIIVNSLQLGAKLLPDPDGSPSVNASSSNDDDGVNFKPISKEDIKNDLLNYSVEVTVNNTTGETANLIGWIDWNRDGKFDVSESATNEVSSGISGGRTTGVVELTWSNQPITSSKDTLQYFMRVRITTDVMDATNTGGAFSNGEVEDYLIKQIPLPVTLISFSVRNEEKKVSLLWTTVSEVNFSHFEVERSRDAKGYAKIGTVYSANGEYKFTDQQPVAGLNYYRLKMIDQDGSFAYSRAQSVDYSGEPVFAYPNPVVTSISLKGIVEADVKHIELINTSGKVVYKTEVLSGNGINVQSVGTGIYLVKITLLNGAVKTQKVVVSK